ncbi:F0F1 ATP synthase subunit gamma, partial [Buchnera aphidicola]|nr:F0F1 ATP synthase subunit gamma [Buchnera aphidicola]
MKGKQEIRCKINSVINTQKITKAMEMVAASKMKKTEKRMLSGRFYFNTIKSVINNVIQGSLEYKHIYLNSRKVKRIGIILVSTDRGLCGGLNANLFKEVLLKLKFYKKKNVSCEFILLGTKAISFFHELNYCVLSKI